MKKFIICAVILLSLCAASELATAQMNNRPFSFNNTIKGNSGISLGGKQAILNEKINDATPRDLVRNSDGSLLDIEKGPGDSAIVSIPGGNFISSYRGRSFRADNAEISAGVFNAYFVPHGNSNGGSSFAHEQSSATVSTWTGRVISNGMPVSYSPNSAVDAWTGMAYAPY